MTPWCFCVLKCFQTSVVPSYLLPTCTSPLFWSQEPSDPDNPLAKGPSPKQVFLRDAGVCFPGLFVESPAPFPSALLDSQGMEVLKARIPLMGQGSHAEFVAQTSLLFVKMINPQSWGPEVQYSGAEWRQLSRSFSTQWQARGIFSRVFLGHPNTQLNAEMQTLGAGGTKVRKRFAEFVTLPGAYFFPSFHNSETSPRLSHAVRCVHIMTGTISWSGSLGQNPWQLDLTWFEHTWYIHCTSRSILTLELPKKTPIRYFSESHRVVETCWNHAAAAHEKSDEIVTSEIKINWKIERMPWMYTWKTYVELSGLCFKPEGIVIVPRRERRNWTGTKSPKRCKLLRSEKGDSWSHRGSTLLRMPGAHIRVAIGCQACSTQLSRPLGHMHHNNGSLLRRWSLEQHLESLKPNWVTLSEAIAGSSTKTHCRPMVQSDSEDDLARCTGVLWEICLLFSCKAGPNTPIVRTIGDWRNAL